jgi:hypothetical protein
MRLVNRFPAATSQVLTRAHKACCASAACCSPTAAAAGRPATRHLLNSSATTQCCPLTASPAASGACAGAGPCSCRSPCSAHRRSPAAGGTSGPMARTCVQLRTKARLDVRKHCPFNGFQRCLVTHDLRLWLRPERQNTPCTCTWGLWSMETLLGRDQRLMAHSPVVGLVDAEGLLRFCPPWEVGAAVEEV